MTAFAPLLELLEAVPDPRRAEGKVYRLPHVLLFSILAIVSGGNSYRSVATFIDEHRRRLNRTFGLTWRRAPAHTSIRNILQGLDSGALETVFRRHAGLLQTACAKPGGASLAIDGKTLRGSFDQFRDRAAAQVLGVFATDTALVLAPATSTRSQTRSRPPRRCSPNSAWLAGWSRSMPCTASGNLRPRRQGRSRSDHTAQGQPAHPASAGEGPLRQRHPALCDRQP